MNCETCQTDLEDLLYGEVDRAWKIALHEHLSVCVDCRARYSTLERENDLFAQFYEQTALEPSDEMWQGIHKRLKTEVPQVDATSPGWTGKLRDWFAPLLQPARLRQAGFAFLLILLSVGLTALYFSSRKVDNNQLVEVIITPTPSPMATIATQPTPNPNGPTPNLREGIKPQVAALKTPSPKVVPKQIAPQKLTEDEALAQQIAKASREYQGAIRLLERTIAKRKTQLDEGTIKQFEGSLAMIDASIASSREALRAHPTDPSAARFLLSAYSKKVGLMQEIAMR